MLVVYLLISVMLIVLLTVRFKVHPFIALLLVALMYGFAAGMPAEQIIASVNEGFGKTLGGIGLIIILGVIIGTFLENSGGAMAIAAKVLSLVGKKRVAPAMGGIGYFVSIPVFADSAFLLLSPLNKSLTKKAKLSLAGTAIALSLGVTASHTMVPPTPGPIAAAGILGADLGLVLLVGLPVSIIALMVGILFATKYAARTNIDPDAAMLTSTSEAEALHYDADSAPSVLKSTLPIGVPILLIVAKSLVVALGAPENVMTNAIQFLGEPFIALLIGVFLSLLLPKHLNRDMLSCNGWVGKAMANCASILLITGAGGIFGKMLQNSGIAQLLGDAFVDLNAGILLPFLIAAAIKTAQGSSTVALITTASIISPLMASLGFTESLEKAMVVIAIGAGSAVVSHANDSFFWVVTQMSGMDVKTGYRLQSLGTFVLGASAISCLLIAHSLLF
ncbi:GntP family permease [Alteromonadaceae bacterium BrNp21-10]|nr:GntP family permease [Alteromonadaceae bacterium BrNp21-10]